MMMMIRACNVSAAPAASAAATWRRARRGTTIRTLFRPCRLHHGRYDPLVAATTTTTRTTRTTTAEALSSTANHHPNSFVTAWTTTTTQPAASSQNLHCRRDDDDNAHAGRSGGCWNNTQLSRASSFLFSTTTTTTAATSTTVLPSSNTASTISAAAAEEDASSSSSSGGGEWMSAVQDLLDDKRIEDAHSFIDSIMKEKTTTTNIADLVLLQKCKLRLIDACLETNRDILATNNCTDKNENGSSTDAMTGPNDDMKSKAGRGNSSSGSGGSSSHDGEESLLSSLRRALQLTERAHDLLESVHPFFSARYFPPAYYHEEQAGNFATMRWGGVHGTAAPEDTQHFVVLGSTASASASACASIPPVKDDRSPPPSLSSDDDEFDLSRRCSDILSAWSDVSRAFYNYIHENQADGSSGSRSRQKRRRPRWMRDVPQRAQFLLERMEASFRQQGRQQQQQQQQRGDDSVGVGIGSVASSLASGVVAVQPTVHDYNRVLECWALSGEHRRGAMAERVFHQLLSSPSARANGESHRNVVSAWARSDRDRNAAAAATRHLRRMLRKLEEDRRRRRRHDDNDDDNDMEPSLNDYHIVLRSWVNNAEDTMAPFRAKSILQMMYEACDDGSSAAQPDFDCHKYVLLSAATASQKWNCKQQQQQQQQPSQQQQQQQKREPRRSRSRRRRRGGGTTTPANDIDDDDHRVSYGALVDEVLASMKSRLMVPDSACYGAAIRAWKNCALLLSNTSSSKDSEHKRRRRQSSGGGSDRGGYSDDNDSSMLERSVRRTLELLEEMNVAHGRSAAVSVCVGTEQVNDAIEALSVSSDRRRTEKAERLLQALEDGVVKLSATKKERGGGFGTNGPPETAAAAELLPPPPAVPNADSYRLVLDVWNSSDAGDRVPRAKAVLWRMREHRAAVFTNNNGTNNKKKLTEQQQQQQQEQILDVYNAFVRVCATSEVNNNSEHEGMHILREALTEIKAMPDIMKDVVLVASGDNDNNDDDDNDDDSTTVKVVIRPNAATYTALLEACKNLLPAGKEQRRLIEMVFHLCCKDGMVDENVLQRLKEVASADQYTQLVVVPSSSSSSSSGTDSSDNDDEHAPQVKTVPEAWTVHALGGGGGRILTADGKRTTPLSIGGRLTVTRAMQEFKMRRIRSRRNRDLLQGGRLAAAATRPRHSRQPQPQRTRTTASEE